MKKTNVKQPEKRTFLLLSVLQMDPENEDLTSDHQSDDDQLYDGESQEINKDPVIGGADDVYRENPSDDLRDSDLVDEEPLQDGTKQVEDNPETLNKDELATPYDRDEEDEEISNLEDTQDLMGGESLIDDETTI